MAREIDEDAPVAGGPSYSGHGNGYHNRNHMLEVLVSAATLADLHTRKAFEPKLSSLEKLVLVTAALAHDIGHDGKGNGKGSARIPMKAEQYSIALARPILETKFKEADRESEFPEIFTAFETLIVSTDIGGGPASPGKYVADIAKWQRGERTEFPAMTAPELSKLSLAARCPKIAEMCCLLQDADLLPSIGMTPEWAERQDIGMGKEDPSRMTASGEVNWKGTVWFHNNLADLKSLAGRCFSPSFEAIKSYVADMQKKQNGLNPA